MRQAFLLFLIAFSITSFSNCLAGEDELESNLFSKMIIHAELSNAIYEGKSALGDVANQFKLIPDDVINIPDIDISFVLVTDDAKKQQIVVIRGTANVENVIVDMDIKLVEDAQTGVSIHKGFLDAGNSIYKEVKSQLNNKYEITTTGHSLGGAVAVVLAMKMKEDGFNVDAVTFGQPKVTNVGGANKFKSLNITRVVRPKDIVPIVPPVDVMDIKNLDIYWHLGKEIILNNENEYAELEGVKSMLRGADFITTVPTQEHVENHSMTGYLSRVKSNSTKTTKVAYKTSFNPMKLFGK